MMEHPVVILGGGCAGLAAALRLSRCGHRVVVVERDDHVGGLAGGVHINGNTYEYGPHVFHTTDPEVLGDVTSLMGDALAPFTRTIRIKFRDRYFAFPLRLQDVLAQLPLRTVAHAALSALWHRLAGVFSRPAEETSETVLTRAYGRVLYEIFFESYITAVWGIPPAGFAPSFARERIPRMSILGVADRLTAAVRGRFGRAVTTGGFVEKVEGRLFTTERGFSLITERMAGEVVALGGRVALDTTVTRLRREGDRLTAVDITGPGGTSTLACSGVINTLPVNEAVLLVDPMPADDVRASAGALQFRALVFVGLLVRHARALPASLMYFREHTFNRLSDLSQFGFRISPQGCTLLVAEISCAVGDRPWADAEFAKQAVIRELAAESLLVPEDVLEAHVYRAEHAYPIYALHYEAHLSRLLRFFDDLANAETAGRQGRFAYVNGHVAMKMGYEAADRLTGRRPS